MSAPKYTGTFSQAFAKAHNDLGAGRTFEWTRDNKLYTTDRADGRDLRAERLARESCNQSSNYNNNINDDDTYTDGDDDNYCDFGNNTSNSSSHNSYHWCDSHDSHNSHNSSNSSNSWNDFDAWVRQNEIEREEREEKERIEEIRRENERIRAHNARVRAHNEWVKQENERRRRENERRKEEVRRHNEYVKKENERRRKEHFAKMDENISKNKEWEYVKQQFKPEKNSYYGKYNGKINKLTIYNYDNEIQDSFFTKCNWNNGRYFFTGDILKNESKYGKYGKFLFGNNYGIHCCDFDNCQDFVNSTAKTKTNNQNVQDSSDVDNKNEMDNENKENEIETDNIQISKSPMMSIKHRIESTQREQRKAEQKSQGQGYTHRQFYIRVVNNETDSINMFNTMTFNAEGSNVRGPYYSRVVHHPTPRSGITIGRGYDMKSRSQREIQSHLIESGVDKSDAETLSKAAKLSEDDAKKWIATNKNFIDKFKLTETQENNLYGICYNFARKDIQRICYKKEVIKKYGQAPDWNDIDPVIREIIIDLRFRGDSTPATREKYHPYVVRNDVQGLLNVMKDKKVWGNVPADRFKRRIATIEKALKN